MANRKGILRKHVQEVTIGIRYPDGMTKAIAEDITKSIKQGAPPRAACGAAGVSFARFEKWMARGKLMSMKLADGVTTQDQLADEDSVCYAFFTMIMGALSRAAVYCSWRLRKNLDWRAQAWRMDKIYRDFMDPEPKADVPQDGDPNAPKVIIYMPDNGRSTR